MADGDVGGVTDAGGSATMDASMKKMEDTFQKIAAQNLDLTTKKAALQMSIDIAKTKPQ